MNNEDILKENGGKKFDVVLMNPPYSDKSGDSICLNNLITINERVKDTNKDILKTYSINSIKLLFTKNVKLFIFFFISILSS